MSYINRKNRINWHIGCCSGIIERGKRKKMEKVIRFDDNRIGSMKPQRLTRMVFALLAGAILTLLATIPALAQTRQEQAELKVVVGEVEVLRRGTTTWQPA